jgi:acetyl esterase/lipase
MVVGLLRSRPAPSGATVQAIREHMDSMARVFPVPGDVVAEPVRAGGFPAEWIAAPPFDPGRAVLYLHGGAYVFGSLRSHRELASRVARAAGARALAIEYRLAPEHPFPAAVDDAVEAYRWMLAQGIKPEKIAIAGDSAGGGLTVATLVALRDAGEPLPAAGVCLSPWVDLEGLGASMTLQAARDPIIQKANLLEMAAHYLGGADAKSPLASPLHADLAGLPPLFIQVSTAETLYDDAIRLAERAKGAGVDVTLDPWEDLLHVWHIFPMVPEAREAIDRVGRFLKQATG